MEDERGAGGHDGGPDPGLSTKLAVENMGSETQAAEVFGDEDGEEIMVEVVGSDVFVDGISGSGEGDVEMGEAGDLEVGVVDKNEEFAKVSIEGDGKKMGKGGVVEEKKETAEGDLGVSKSRDEKCGATEKININLSDFVGVEMKKVSALLGGGVSSVKDEESSRIKKPGGSSLVVSEVPAEVSMEICKEENTKDEMVDKESSEEVRLRSLNRPVEAISDEKSELPTGDDSASQDHVAADSVKSEGQTEETCHGNDGAILGSDGQKDGETHHDDSGVEEKSIGEKDVCAAENRNSVPEMDDIVSEVPDESEKRSDEICGAKVELKDQTDDISHAGPESIHKSTFESRAGETEGKDDLETHKAQNDVSSVTPIELADGGDTTEANKGRCLDVEIKDEAEETVQSKTGAETGDQNVVMSPVKAVDGIGSEGEGKEIDSENLGKSVAGHEDSKIPSKKDVHGDVVDEGMEVGSEILGGSSTGHGGAEIPAEEGANAKVETADVMVTEGLVTEVSNPEAENTIMEQSEVTDVAADSGIAQVSIVPEGTGSAEMLSESNGFHLMEAPEDHMSEAKPMDVDDGREVDAELASEGSLLESDKSKISTEALFNYAGALRMKQFGYLMPPGKDGCFAPSDLVWGKVRSHPWWPGQIFNSADASEKAVKYHKKDSYLVAYFGDQTFAWNDSSALKPFRSYFSQIQKQSNSESFHNAVGCALEEIERRVQLGLSCSCTPKDEHARIETQVVENTGIREESSLRHGVDQSSCASQFEPKELIEFIKGVAPRASSGADGLDLVIARAQLSAFCCFKGYRSPPELFQENHSSPEFPASNELLEIDDLIGDGIAASRKHRTKEGAQSRKERSLNDLMGDGEYWPDAEDDPVAGKKRKALDPLAEGSDKRVAKVPTPTSQAPKPSFKIGDCIRRVASQLTAVDDSPSVYEPSEKQGVVVSVESLSVNELLSRLELVAEDPKRRPGIQTDIRAFFMRFRSSIALSRRGRKKRSEQAVGGSGEEFEFDDVNDSYWTDRIVQNYSAEQLMHERMNGSGNLELVTFGAEKPAKPGRKPYSRKRFSLGNSPTSAPEPDESAKRIKQETSPAELILNFAERNRVPSEINLNKMFRRFGPLMESETEVDHEAGSAKVIFKRGSDAEVARNSAEKFNIFGPVLVNYEIGYSPVISVRISPVTISLPQEEAAIAL
ncbi:uncharacterized protein LOC121751536 [Salvia splendens]|uniref:uncharacterized protein LOC121751536 n=1 Tax=Salvia splendens TaxID=180675 RepID=UPI001C267C37|nr:uncharacterized protein LOC121751536 [Salvia splendens]XP_042002224.1 uncharacterized protein LOC121751536 [Salvia splendens]XP_042002225.1 uncharacterized protein LOC121751536 [Salvia splendens]XP_042002226.1 uncharacterized protein LOC121751536 [Salvia splendens]